jgi:hypothetical protein
MRQKQFSCVDLAVEFIRLYDLPIFKRSMYPPPYAFTFEAVDVNTFKDIPDIQRVEDVACFIYYCSCRGAGFYTGSILRVGVERSLYIFKITDVEEAKEMDKKYSLVNTLKKFVVYENFLPVAQFEVAPYDYLVFVDADKVGELIAMLVNNGWRVLFK